jgi:Flp pilus assembly protein TadG
MMKRQKTQYGVAAIEFAIVLIPMVFIVFGLSEFGRAIYQYNTVTKATRDAARYLTTQQAGTKVAEAQCLVRYGDASCMTNSSFTGPLLAPGLASATISICHSANCAANAPIPAINNENQGTDPVINMVTVSVGNYRFQSLVPFVTANLATITFDNISTSMRTQL